MTHCYGVVELHQFTAELLRIQMTLIFSRNSELNGCQEPESDEKTPASARPKFHAKLLGKNSGSDDIIRK